MKKVLTFIGALAFLLISTFAFAQAPQKFNYQGIARDAKGNPMSKQTLALKLSVLPTSDATVPEYEETQLVTTNEFGLYTLQIGNGTAITGEMKTVKWETGNKYIKVAIDPTGGTNYVDAGTNQLLSVPYALYADKAGESRTSASGSNETRSGTVSTSAAGTGTANYLTKFTGANTIYNSQIFDNGSQIGIGTTSPSTTAKLHISSVTGTQPLILESPVGVHSLIREAGSNRGYFGSYIGSGAPYPTPAGTSNADFDIGTSGSNPTGKLHLATNTTPRVTILPTTGNVGIGTTSPTTKLEVVGQVKITGGTPGAGKVLTSDATGLATWQTPISGGSQWTTLGSNIYNNNTGNVGIGLTNPLNKFEVLGTSKFKGLGTSTIFSDVLVEGSSFYNGINIKATSGNKGAGIMFTDGTSGVMNGSIFVGSVGSIYNGNLIISAEDNGNTAEISVNKATKNVGIGLFNAPAKLSVAGGSWDLSTQPGDVQIGDGSYNLKMGISTGGGGAGHATIAANGGINELSLGTGNTYPNLRTLNITNGKVGIGTITPAVPLDLTTAANATTVSGFSTLMTSRIMDTTSTTAEKTGLYISNDGSSLQNSAIFTEVNSTSGPAANIGLFTRVSATPSLGGISYGLLAYDAVNNTNTYAAYISGKMQYINGANSSTPGAVLTNDGNSVAQWSGPVRFNANGLGNSGVLAGNGATIAPLIFNTEIYDASSSYNPTTGVFTVPEDGVYHFDYGIEFSGSGGATTGYVQLNLRVNGSLQAGTASESGVNAMNSYWTISKSCDIKLNAGDVVDVYARNSTNASLNITSDSFYNTFSGHIIR